MSTAVNEGEAFDPSKLEYGFAQADDAEDMLRIHQAAFVAGYKETNPGTTEENLIEFVKGDFAKRNRIHWQEAIKASEGNNFQLPVARYAGVTVHFAFGERTNAFYEVRALYGHPFRGRGIGGHLLGMLLEHQGEKVARLDVAQNAPAIEFYKAHGFYITDTPRPMPEQPKACGIMLHQVEMRRDPQQLTI